MTTSTPANRTVYQGDTFPPAQFQLSDVTGVLDVSTAQSIMVYWVGDKGVFSGAGAAIHPAIPDPDPNSSLTLNCSYSFAAGDTANVDNYNPYVVVTWTTGQIQTFAIGNGLSVKARTGP